MIRAAGVICSVAAAMLVHGHNYGMATYCALMAVWSFIDDAVDKFRKD